MSLIQLLKFKTCETRLFKMPRLETIGNASFSNENGGNSCLWAYFAKASKG